MNLKYVKVLSILLAGLVLTSCGMVFEEASDRSDSSNSSMGMDAGKLAVEPGFAAGSVVSQAIIRTADLTIETSDVSKIFDQAKSQVEQLGGRIESSSYFDQGSSNGPSAYLTVRIPEEKLDAVIEEVSKLGNRTALNIYSSDVTLQVVDLKAKVDALTTSRDRLLDLLNQATSTADLIAAEQALANTQGELDSYQSQLDYLDSQVAESTLTIQVADDASSITDGLRGISETLLITAQNFLKAFENIVIFIGTAIPWLLVGSVLYLSFRGTKRLLKKRRKR